MVSPRFINILLILICLLRFSSGQVSVKKKMTIISTAAKLQIDRSSVNVQEQMHQGATAETRFGGGGREIEVRRLSKVIESQNWIAEASSSSTDGKVHDCIETSEFKGFEKRKFRKRSRSSMRVKMSGFVSWNADYHVPRPHPPKNN